MKVAIATVQVPFIRGGAEILAESLQKELRARGYSCDIVSIPFKWYPGETLLTCMLMGRLLDLTEVNGEPIDLVIALKFPAYYLRHDNKVVWLLHQHRQAFELWKTEFGDLHTFPGGERTRQMITEHDNQYLGEARRIFTLSRNVTERLARYNGLPSTPLYHPAAGHEKYFCESYEPFLFCPGRIDKMKRQRLVVEAARHLRSGMKIVIAGQGSQNETSYLQDLISDHGLGDRVVMAGYVSEAEKLAYYARCRGVFFGGYDEDYGYVVLEAFYARKPVLTLQDTGGALEFVKNGHNGFIVPADAPAVAERIDALGSDQVMAERLGTAGAETIKEMKIDWDHVISSLIGTANA